MSIVVGTWPPWAVWHSRVENEEPGLAEIPRQIAANCAGYEGHLRGGATVNGIPNPAPLNPSGDFGEDHSGGYFGRKLFRTIATFTRDNFESYATAGYVAGADQNGQSLDFQLYSGIGAPSTTSKSEHWPYFYVWVPPCDPVDGAYVDLGILIEGDLFQATSEAGDTASLVVVNNHEGLRNAGLGYPQKSLSLGTITSTGAKVIESGATTRLKVVPGSINPLQIWLELTRSGAGSDRAIRFDVREVELGVYAA